MKALEFLINGVKKLADRAPGRFSSFGARKYFYKNSFFTGVAFAGAIVPGIVGAQNAIDRTKTQTYVQTENKVNSYINKDKTINFQDAENYNSQEKLTKDSEDTIQLSGSNYFSTPDSTFSYNKEQINKLETKANIIDLNYIQSSTIKNMAHQFPIVNKKGKIIGYTDADKGYSDGLFRGEKLNFFYDKPTSDEIQKDLMKSRKGKAFDGDRNLDATKQHHNKTAGSFTFEYVGGGGEGEERNWDYYNQMLTGPFNSTMDINLNGNNADTQDKQMLKDRLLNNVRYLPNDFDYLQTSTERQANFMDFINLDNTQIPKMGWTCVNYARQLELNGDWCENLAGSGLNFNMYDTTNFYDKPVYYVSTQTSSNESHAINAILIGDSITSFSDWLFIEPQNDQVVTIGSASMGANSFANIKKFARYYHTPSGQYVYGVLPLVNFDLQGGQVTNVTVPMSETVLTRTLENVAVQGTKPVDMYVEYVNGQIDTTPANTGWPTNVYPTSLEKIRFDSVVVTGPVEGTVHRGWKIKQDNVIDSVLAHTWQIYNRLEQIIEWGDTTDPNIEANQVEDSVLYSYYIANGLLKPTVTDNSNLWDSTYAVTTTQGTDPDLCSFYEFLATATTNAWDSASPPNTSSLIENVDVYLDDPTWTYFPEDDSLDFRIPTTIAGTGGPATATSPSGPAGVEGVINTYINPDTMTCGNVNYLDEIVYTATDSACGKTTTGTQTIYKFKPMALFPIYFPPNMTVMREDTIGPPHTGEPIYQDSIKPWYPTGYLYNVVRVDSNEFFEKYHVIFNGTEYICNTVSGDSIQVVMRDLEVGINEGGLENRLRKDYVKVFPNPTQRKINLEYDVSKLEKVNTEIYSMDGRLVDLFQEQIFPGENHSERDLNLPNGTYIIQTSIGNEIIETDKIVIIK